MPFHSVCSVLLTLLAQQITQIETDDGWRAQQNQRSASLLYYHFLCLWKYVIRNLKGVDGHYNTHHDYLPIVDLFNSLTNDSIMLKRILFLFSDHATLEVAF